MKIHSIVEEEGTYFVLVEVPEITSTTDLDLLPAWSNYYA